MPESTTPRRRPHSVARPRTALAAVFQVRDGALQVLLWERAREPFRGAWSLPGGALGPDETLEASILRHLAAKVDVRDVAHLEQLGTWSDPGGIRSAGSSRPRISGSSRSASTPRAGGHALASGRRAPPTAFDHGEIALAGRERLRGKLSYSNIGFALAPETFTLAELRDIYAAALGYDVSATNLKRILLRRGAIEPTGERRDPGPAGGRPAEVFRFGPAARGHRPVRRLPPADLSRAGLSEDRRMKLARPSRRTSFGDRENAALSKVAARDRNSQPVAGPSAALAVFWRSRARHTRLEPAGGWRR